MKKILLLALAVVGLASCSKQDGVEQLPSDGSVLFTSEIQTRASGTAWDDNDVIGIYALNSSDSAVVQGNVPYKTTTDNLGMFTPTTSDKIYYPAGGENADFVAYYPYQNSISDVAYVYSVDVTDQSYLPAIDLMYSNNLAGASFSTSAQQLQFTHQLSRIKLNISGVSDTELKGAQVKLRGLYATADFDLKTGKLTSTGSKTDISLAVSGDGKSAEAIMIPQSVSWATIELNLPNKVTKLFEVSALAATTKFEAGNTYLYNILLNVPVTGITLNKSSFEFYVGDADVTLTPTIAPVDATNKAVTWSSSNTAVATVNAETGVVTAVKGGTATITATAADGKGANATCEVTVFDYYRVNGIKVAIGNLVANGAGGCKIGAPTDGGLYFQFGSLVGWSGGATGDGTGRGTGNTLSVVVSPTGTPALGSTTWNTDNRWKGNSGNVPPNFDPCRRYLGRSWRLPTKDEFVTLFNNHGYHSTGPWNAEGTFDSGRTDSYATHTSGLKFPASGYRRPNDGSLNVVGSLGYFWSSSVSSATYGDTLYFSSNYVSPQVVDIRSYGFPVRCVQE